MIHESIGNILWCIRHVRFFFRKRRKIKISWNYVFHSPIYFDPWHVNMDIASPLWPFLLASVVYEKSNFSNVYRYFVLQIFTLAGYRAKLNSRLSFCFVKKMRTNFSHIDKERPQPFTTWTVSPYEKSTGLIIRNAICEKLVYMVHAVRIGQSRQIQSFGYSPHIFKSRSHLKKILVPKFVLNGNWIKCYCLVLVALFVKNQKN